MNKIILFSLILISQLIGQKEIESPIEYKLYTDIKDIYPGEVITLNIDIELKNDFFIYTSNPEISLSPSIVYWSDSSYFDIVGILVEPNPKIKYDPNFKMDIGYHQNLVNFSQQIKISDKLKSGNYSISGTFEYQVCNPTKCIPHWDDFIIDINVLEGIPRVEYLKQIRTDFIISNNSSSVNELDQIISEGFISFIIFSFGMGLLALLTPCVFPMIPITISFFTKLGERVKSDRQNLDSSKELTPLKAATVYALGIIIIFTFLGLVLALTLGASGAQQIAQNPWINLLIGLLFIFFAFSLFGYYELQAPQFITQYSMKQESRSGYTGILFMSLTFTLASFTCTAALVGALLVAASRGEYFWPIIGMVSFSTAFASPFFLLALFPQYLAKLPKSGGWLNSVKVIMGFLELAAAFKFISNSDLVWKWDFFNREVVLFIWVVILLCIAFYSLGFILFPNDTRPNKISSRRKIVFLITMILGMYLSTGLFAKKIYKGNSSILKFTSGLVESYLPPPPSQWIEDLDKAFVKAKLLNKPLFLDFTGYTCTNCRWMEINVFEEPEIQKLFENFILVKLYTDGTEEKHKIYRELEVNRFKTSALPFYVILSPDDKEIARFPGMDPDIEKFASFLKDAIKF